MADPAYRTFNLLMNSAGIDARTVDDARGAQSFLNEDNCEELAEAAVGSRLGTSIINRDGNSINALSGLIHSVNKLGGLNGNAWRYAGSGGNLYRRAGLNQGPYTLISSTLSGQPWQAVAFRPEISSAPYLYVADAAGMLKDNGTLATPQQMGIFQPQYPVIAQAQAPDQITLDDYTGSIGDYVFGSTTGTLGTYVNTTTTSAITATGIQSVSVADNTQPGLFQVLSIDSGGSAEEVLVIQVLANGFVANFTKTHASGVAVTNADLTMSVAASTNAATVSKSFAGTPIAAWPTTLQQEDYIGLYLFVSNPENINSITIKFDCGDGSFNTDYFWKVVGQGPLQSLLDTASTDPATAATDSIVTEALGVYGTAEGNIAQLNTGMNQWTPLLIQLSDFAGAGRADFNDPVFNWQNVNGYQISIVTNSTGSADVGLSSLVLFGGSGPDSFAGVAYDYLFTFYNNVDGTESNPCMVMSNINPPLQTNWALPRRQPVELTFTFPTLDTQTTSLRVYRRGGTLGDNYRRLDEVIITGSPQKYRDIAADADIQAADLISFTNDVPVTSTLPVPVNTVLAAAIATTNQVISVFPASMANISVSQQVDIGSVTATGLTNNFEVVVVLQVFSDHFTAFVQNTHDAGETVSATAKYGQPVTIMALAFGQMWFAGDTNNPHYLYYSDPDNPQGVGSANFVEVGTPDDPITVVVAWRGNLYVSTKKFWYSVAPGTNGSAQSPTVYPTAAKHGCVAPLGFVALEDVILYQAIDGIRAFAGGASTYLTQGIEFIFQDIGTTPIVEANQAMLNQTRAAYWNNMVFFSYIGVDGNRHRVIYHAEYKRWRNDDLDVQSLYLEADTNTLIFGDSNGIVHQDRTVLTYDEGNNAGQLSQVPIAMNFQLPYLNQGTPETQKSYQEFTLDINTNGQNVDVTLWFDDGESSLSLGTVNTTERQRVNVAINTGEGVQGYKVSLQLTCQALQRVYIYQSAIRGLVLARTRTSFDSYWVNDGTDTSKFCKQVFLDWNSTDPLECQMFYDQDPTPYSFTLEASPQRQIQRTRLPAIKYRLRRLIINSDADFQLWEGSHVEAKDVGSGKSYRFELLSPDS